jgi:hypothetical protein
MLFVDMVCLTVATTFRRRKCEGEFQDQADGGVVARAEAYFKEYRWEKYH